MLTCENINELNSRSEIKYTVADAYFHSKPRWMPSHFFGSIIQLAEAKFRKDVYDAGYDGLVNRRTVTYNRFLFMPFHYVEGTPIRIMR